MITNFKINGKEYDLMSEPGLEHSYDITKWSDKGARKHIRKDNDDNILIQGDDGHKYLLSADEMKIKGMYGLPKSGDKISFVDSLHRVSGSFAYKPKLIEGTVIKSRNNPEIVEKIGEQINNWIIPGYGGIGVK